MICDFVNVNNHNVFSVYVLEIFLLIINILSLIVLCGILTTIYTDTVFFFISSAGL